MYCFFSECIYHISYMKHIAKAIMIEKLENNPAIKKFQRTTRIQYCILCKEYIFNAIALKPLILFGFFIVYVGYINNNQKAYADIDLEIISKIESSNRSFIYGDGGKALGKFQIHAAVVKEFNTYQKKNLTHKNMLNPVEAQEVADWYLHKRIPQILRWLKLPLNNSNILGCWNAGCGNVKKGYMPKKYLEKYKKLGGAL